MERINVIGTANVIQACRSNDVRRLLHFSSVVAVGASLTPTDVLDESSAYNVGRWDLGYFETKRKAERLVKDCVEAGQLDAVIVNPSTIYGASDAEKGSRGVQVKVARGRMPFFTIGGASIIDIDSVVQATFAAWRSGRSGERYILSGENLTIEDIFGLIAKAAGVAPPSHCLPTWLALSLGRCGDIVESLGGRAPLSWESARVATLYHWFKNDKARAELGLRPLPAATAIENSVRWMKERGLLDG
jgi:dihydroflavonol-4-reductase